MLNKNLANARYWAVVPAAGSGERMQTEKPKQYLSLKNRTIIEYSLMSLLSYPKIEKVVVVLSAHDKFWSQIANQLPFANKILTVVGGSSRSASVLNGLNLLSSLAASDDWILVHDAARPCLLHEDIHKLIMQLHNHPIGGLLGIPVRDTLKRVGEDHVVQTTLARDNIWQALTPQMFRYNKLLQALIHAQQQGIMVTDEANAIELIGAKPLMIAGRTDNIKVTYPNDLILAEKLLISDNPV